MIPANPIIVTRPDKAELWHQPGFQGAWRRRELHKKIGDYIPVTILDLDEGPYQEAV